MPTLEQRVKELEKTRARPAVPCFWCDCERNERAAPAACTHGGWKPIQHETALAELD